MKVVYSLVIIFLIFSFPQSCSRNNIKSKNLEKIRIILDTDANNELDDQHAIAYMLFNSHIFDVEGMTVNRTYNGGSIDKHYEEAKRVVKLCSLESQIVIYKGASGTYEEIKDHINKPKFDGSEAVNFIIERAKSKDNRELVLLPVGKLTNIALALKKAPEIVSKVRVVWLGSNFPEYGEYNFVNDTTALDPIYNSGVQFEIVTVRYDKETGTDAVVAYLKDFQEKMPGKGPHITDPVIGRHGSEFTNFGDYSVDLFEKFRGSPDSRPLYDMAAVAVLKNPEWAEKDTIGAPKFENKKWIEQPDNPRKVILWENFDKVSIMQDFYNSMNNYHLSNTE